jgi:hypothetical protein
MKFQTFGALADLLESQIGRIPLAKREGLAAAGELVKADAQNRIGSYQGAVAEFSAWAPLSEATKADRVAKGFSADDPLLRTGALRDAIEVKHEPESVVVGVFDSNLTTIAAAMEYGYWNSRAQRPVAPRSFLRAAAGSLFQPIGRAIGERLFAILKG